MAAVEDENPTSSTTTFSKEEVNKLMSQGKRHFVCDEIVEAVKSFEAACLMLSKRYGALSNECGDAHFHYGKSLLELSRLENGVLGSAIKEVIEGEEPVDSDEESTNIDKCGANNDAEMTQVDEENSQNEKPERISEEKMDDNKTESKIENDATDNDKENQKEITTETNEEKSAVDNTEENQGEKMVEEKNKEMKTGDELCSDDKKDIIDQKKLENDDENVSEEKMDEDTSNSNKESMDKEQKEVDEEVDETGEHHTKEETGNEDMGKKDENKTAKEEEDKGNDEDTNDEEKTDEDPVSTIQLAWESLELARIIFKRHSNTEIQLKLSQTHLLLGEIHMEQEQFSDAVSELTKCLNIQKNLLKPDDRLLAETYYNLGLAYTLSMMYDEAANHYGNAIDVLELRMKNIKARIEEAEQKDKGKTKALDDDPLVKDRKELTELEDLLPEVKEKCLDAKNESERLKTNIKEKLGLTSTGVGNTSFTSCSSSCSDKPANDISHLVKRQKRKPKDEEESAETSNTPAKKPRQDGDNSTTQTENGVSTSKELTVAENLS